MRVTFSTILVESSPEAQRNSKFYRNSFNASVEKGNYVIDYMRYGLDAQVFMMPAADGHLSGTAFQWTTNDHNLI